MVAQFISRYQLPLSTAACRYIVKIENTSIVVSTPKDSGSCGTQGEGSRLDDDKPRHSIESENQTLTKFLPPRTDRQKKRHKDLDWYYELVRTKAAPNYDWRKFKKNLTPDERKALLVKFGVTYKRYFSSFADIARDNSTYQKSLPTGLSKHLGRLLHDGQACRPSLENCVWMADLFRANGVDPKQFWTDVQLIADRKDAKKNGFVLTGPINCFKSQVLRLLFGPLKIPTQAGNGRPYYKFWLQSLLYQPICLYEEPRITKATAEVWKQLLSGTAVSVAVKRQPDSLLERTPFFIVTSQEDLWKDVSAEDGRILSESVVSYSFVTSIDSMVEKRGFREAPSRITPFDVYYFFTKFI